MTVFTEGIRLSRACERLGMLTEQLSDLKRTANTVLEIAPELKPELLDLDRRILDILDHVDSAIAVLNAKVNQL